MMIHFHLTNLNTHFSQENNLNSLFAWHEPNLDCTLSNMLSINERTGTYMNMRPEPGVADRVSVFHIISVEELLLGCSLKDDNDVSISHLYCGNAFWKILVKI